MDGTDFSLVSLNLLLKASEKALVQKCLNLTFASRGDLPQVRVTQLLKWIYLLNDFISHLHVFVLTVQPTVETLQALLDITCIEALQVLSFSLLAPGCTFLTINYLVILLLSCWFEQLYRAIYACIDVSLFHGSIEALGELFETDPTAGEVDARLKNLIGQVIILSSSPST